MNETILILGVNGFIGQGVLNYFKKINFKTIGISKGKGTEMQPDVSYFLNLPSSKVREILITHKPGLIVNASGKSSVDNSILNPVSDFIENTNVTIDILNCIREVLPQSKFIYLSSASVYGNPKELPVNENAEIKPISPYGYHKYIGEMICEEFSTLYGIKTASLRIFSAYGNGLKKQVIFDICKKLFNDEIVHMKGTGNESRDFIHVDDLAESIFIIYKNGEMKGEFYNIGTGEETTIKSLASLIFEIASVNKKINFTNTIHQGSPLNWLADISKIKALGFQKKKSLRSGINSYIEWYKEHMLQ